MAAPLPERELVSATIGGAADPATQPPTNGDAPAAPHNQNPNPNRPPKPAPGAAKARAPQPALASGRRAWSCSTSGFCCSVSSGLSSLGPCAFFGSPSKPFELFRDIDGTFYADILSTLVSLLG